MIVTFPIDHLEGMVKGRSGLEQRIADSTSKLCQFCW